MMKTSMNHKGTRIQRKFDRKPNAKPRERQRVLFEVEFLPGLEPFVTSELKHFGIQKIQPQSKETVRFEYKDDIKKLFALRRAVAVYQVLAFPIPRPKALLGDEHLRRLLQGVEAIRALHPKNTFTSFRFSAAGADSAVFQRLAEVFSSRLTLPYDPKEGDLLLVVRPSQDGWEVAIRLTPRPLSARKWRVCNIEGGLNATLAVVMNDLGEVKPSDRYLNAMCGSGTLLIEQGKAKQRVGVDVSERALECARQNLAAGSVKAELLEADATRLPFPENSFEVITADVPWGDAVGTHEGNAKLYPAFLQEMARVSTASARLVVLTHELKLFEKVLADSAWQVKSKHRVFHGGHYPNIYLLGKK
jgi:tRNA (guanine6-N2)-methyltransferase